MSRRSLRNSRRDCPEGQNSFFSDRKGVQERGGLRSDIDEDVYSQMAGCCGNKETWERVEER